MLGEAFALLVWDGWPTALRIACNLTRLESFDIKERIEVSWLVVLVSLLFGFEPGLGAVLDAASVVSLYLSVLRYYSEINARALFTMISIFSVSIHNGREYVSRVR